VTVGIVYNRAGISISIAINFLFGGENITFHAGLVVYIYIYIYIVLMFLQL